MSSAQPQQTHAPHTGGYIDPNRPSPNGDQDASIIIYGYVPALALCIIAIILFFISLFAHIYLLLRHRLWSFSPLALGCLCEVVGYIFRSLSSQRDPYNIIYFVVQYFLIVTAPVFISASIYVCLSKLIRWANDHSLLSPPTTTLTTNETTSASPPDLNDNKQPSALSTVSPTPVRKTTFSQRLLSPRGILYLFITIDILSTITQIAGAALIGSYESDGKDPTKPNNILLAGLAIQTFSFTIYLALLIFFRFSLHPAPSPASTSQSPHTSKDPFILALLISSILVYLRTIFRLAETAQNVYGYLSTHEAFFGALEFAPVVVAVSLLAIFHPGRWVGRDVVLSTRRQKRRGNRSGEVEAGVEEGTR